MRRLTLRFLVLSLGISIAGGCFTYAPIETATVAPDMTVRVHLTASAAERQIEGQVFDVDADGFSLLPEVGAGQSSAPQFLAQTDITTVEVRALDRNRTLLVVGASIAAGVGVLLAVDGNAGATPPGNGGVVFDRIPLFGFSLRH